MLKYLTSTAALIGKIKIIIEINIQSKLNSVNNHNSWEANQLVIYIVWSRI